MLTALCIATLALAPQDCSTLTPGFGAYGVAAGPNGGNVFASAVYDDGAGPALYLGGVFEFAGETEALSIVRFDGTGFQTLPGPAGSDVLAHGYVGVRAFEVFDDGSGPELYVAGDFDTSLGLPQHGIAKWDGATWTPVLTVTSTQFIGFIGVRDLLVWDDGTGPALYFGGLFDHVNGAPAASVAKYDGSGWSTLGSGFAGAYVNALAVHDDGAGPRLYAGGSNAPSQQNVQRWDGASWSLVTSSFDKEILSLCSHDDGSGTALYAGGTFTAPAFGLARWNGAAWSAVGAGPQLYAAAIAAHDDGTGKQLYVVGLGSNEHAARWNGATWQSLQSGLADGAWTLTEWNSGAGTELYVGGEFTHAGGKRADGVAKWTATGWSRIYSSKGLTGGSTALAAVDDGSGVKLYADGGIGSSTASGPVEYGNCIVRWTGTSWAPLPGVGDNRARGFAGFDSGSGLQLHVVGAFTEFGGVTVNHVARFDGSSWHDLSGGVTRNGFPASVNAVCVHDFGAGPRLVVGGNFTAAGGVSANDVAVWDGSAWSALDLGMDGEVFALASYDDGSGAKLYAGGDFLHASGGLVNNLARWNGAAWEALGTGMNREVFELAVVDFGAGKKLCAGGDFFLANGVLAPNIATFDGSTWAALLSGGLALNGRVETIVGHDEGEGTELYVGGWFSLAGGAPANRVARWTGTAWLALDEEPDSWVVYPDQSRVYSLASFDDHSGVGPALFAAGFFGKWDGTPSMSIARIAPQAPCAPVVYCTAKTNSLGCTPSMYTTGSSSLAANNLRLHASNVLNNKNGLLFWSTKPNGAPFQGGHLCCKPPIVRTTVQATAGNPPPNDCSGSLHFHWNQAYVNQLGLPLGDWYYTQYWSRDPNSPSTTSLSNAIRFLLTP
ncbi:MAG: hypothetical protein IT453_15675 [Planctomycetes bacterium]|nr:hypothetical protein [Planctomycetota bacterium]